MIKQERYITGEPQYSVVQKFFDPIIEKYKLTTENALIEYHHFNRTDNAMALLIVNDQLKASVIERRTDFNDIEYTFIEV